MTVDWGIIQFKRKIIDNARYLFTNFIDTSKGLDALYSRPQISSDSAIVHKNFNMVRLTSNTPGKHITAWKIDDASKINKLYVRAKISVTAKWNAALILTDSTLQNCIFFKIIPDASSSDFRINLKRNGSESTIYTESVSLSYREYYQIEGMIDLENNLVSAIRDNVEKPVLAIHTLPSFDVIHLGFSERAGNAVPTMFAKDIFITWE